MLKNCRSILSIVLGGDGYVFWGYYMCFSFAVGRLHRRGYYDGIKLRIYVVGEGIDGILVFLQT